MRQRKVFVIGQGCPLGAEEVAYHSVDGLEGDFWVLEGKNFEMSQACTSLGTISED